MVTGDDLSELVWQVPVAGDNFPALAMRDSHDQLFGFVQWNALAAGFFKAAPEFMRRNPKEGHDTDIVKKSGRVRLSKVGKADARCEFVTHQRAAQGVRPENRGVNAE